MTSIRSVTVPLLAAALLLVAGCFNSPENSSVHFGDVSIGAQLIDLKSAFEQGAIDQAEYDALKQAIMALAEGCGSGGGDE
jgi:hypothetical protein